MNPKDKLDIDLGFALRPDSAYASVEFQAMAKPGSSGSSIVAGISICAVPEQALEFNGQTFTPDGTKGFFSFCFSHAFPVATVRGQALHPNVVAKSFNSLLNQPVNYEHQMTAYNKDFPADKILGSVCAVSFPQMPPGGWKISSDKSTAPAITGVAVFAKLAKGMDRIIGNRSFSVSMEVEYVYKDCAFAVALNGAKPTHPTPDDMVQAGWELIPWVNADADLLSTFSIEAGRIVKGYRGRKVVQLMGGLDGMVHYAGLGIVRHPAEKEAQIFQMAASDTAEPLLRPLSALADLAQLMTANTEVAPTSAKPIRFIF